RWTTRLAILVLVPGALVAQERLKTLPGYEQYQKMALQIPTAIKSGALAATWTDGGKAIEYDREGRRFRFDVATRQTSDVGSSSQPDGGRGRGGAAQPERGRQFTEAVSPDGQLIASYRDRNLWLRAVNSGNEIPITSDGSPTTRVKYG